MFLLSILAILMLHIENHIPDIILSDLNRFFFPFLNLRAVGDCFPIPRHDQPPKCKAREIPEMPQFRPNCAVVSLSEPETTHFPENAGPRSWRWPPFVALLVVSPL